MKCTVLACWVDEDERKEFIEEAKNAGIDKVKFTDGDDGDSTWTFEGDANAVKKFVEDHFQITPKFMPFDDLVKCIEVGAVVDGISMYDEKFSY